MDLIFAGIDPRTIQDFVQGKRTVEQLQNGLEASSGSFVALMGPIFLARVQHVFASKDLALSDVAALIDFTKTTLSSANLSGNSFHCLRTFHLVMLLADFVENMPSISSVPRNLDVVFAEFVAFCAGQSAAQWNKMVLNFVPQHYIPLIMQHFIRISQITSSLLSDSNPETARFSYETMRALNQRLVFPPAGHIECFIASKHEVSLIEYE
jgi:hypothetical protein